MDKAPATNPTINQDIHRDAGFREGPANKQPGAKAPGTVQPPGSDVGQGAATDVPGEDMNGEASPGLTISGGGGHA
jgi:hypothetical protein